MADLVDCEDRFESASFRSRSRKEQHSLPIAPRDAGVPRFGSKAIITSLEIRALSRHSISLRCSESLSKILSVILIINSNPELGVPNLDPSRVGNLACTRVETSSKTQIIRV